MIIEKKGVIFFFLAVIYIISLPLVSAGFSDWFSGLIDITGLAPSSTTTVAITLANSAPNVSFVSENVNATFSPSEGDLRVIEFTVLVDDVNGDADIGNMTANFSQGSLTRVNNTCERGDVGTDSDTANFSCTIELQYFDPNGDYTIGITANDTSGASDQNDTVTLTYDLLTGMNLSVSSLTLTSANPDDYNVTNSTDSSFLNVTNTGNQALLYINATAIELSTSSSSDTIPAENFTFANISIDYDGASFAECQDETIDGAQTQNLINDTTTSVNGTISRGAAETSSLYLCLRHVPAGIGAYTYDTTLGGTWTILVDPTQ